MDSEWIDGLPPVGCECEIAEHRPARGHKLYIFAHHAGHAFGWDEAEDSAYFSDDPDDFRPIRTKEREEVIAEARVKAGIYLDLNDALGRLYDAGLLRKEPKK